MTIKGWIITGIVSLIVGFILLNIEYSFFSKKGDTVESLSNKANKIVEQLEPIKTENAYFTEPDIDNLQTLLNTASQVYNTTKRTSEYIKIINLSLNEGKPMFAFTVAKKIYGTNKRDDQYSNIIDKSLKLKKYALAKKVAEHVYSTTKRDAQYRKIIQAGMQERIDSINLKNSKPKTFEPGVSPISKKINIKMILTHLNKTSLDQNKIAFIEENMQSMPDTITLSELNLMLDLITLDDAKIELAKLFSQKINKRYTNNDFDNFTNKFSLDRDRNKATSILLQR